MSLKDAKRRYRNSAVEVLAGYQIIESFLKHYLRAYYEAVRHLLSGRLHFDFHGSDVETFTLNRLVNLFSKTSANKNITAALRPLMAHRDEVAHRAFDLLYSSDLLEEQYLKLEVANWDVANKLADIQDEILHEWSSLIKLLDPDWDPSMPPRPGIEGEA